MSEISRQQLIELRGAIQTAIQNVASVHGVDLKVGGGSYGPTGSLKIEISPISDSGEVETKEAKAFKRSAVLYGLKPEHLGAEFTSRGRRFKITGLNTRARTYPIQAVTIPGGERFKFPADQVARAVNG